MMATALATYPKLVNQHVADFSFKLLLLIQDRLFSAVSSYANEIDIALSGFSLITRTRLISACRLIRAFIEVLS